LSPPVLHILAALAERERHGYAVMQAVREQSGGALVLRTGSFYRYLSLLIDHGLVGETSGPAGDDPRRGAYYRLTPRGRRRLAEERRRLVALIEAIEPSLPRKGSA
jgi:DNA-binding PadR family transcriptional regulator